MYLQWRGCGSEELEVGSVGKDDASVAYIKVVTRTEKWLAFQAE